MTYTEEVKYNIFSTMSKYGGSFVQNLASLWFSADRFNRSKIETTFSDYMEEYGPDSTFYKSLFGPILVSSPQRSSTS